MNFPEELRYTSDHEWVRIDGHIATIGITDFAQNELGDIVFVDIPTVGQTVEMGKIFGSVEAVKTVSDLFMPLSGVIESVNEELNNNPDLVNSDPYSKGWMIKVKINNTAQIEELLSASAYSQSVGA